MLYIDSSGLVKLVLDEPHSLLLRASIRPEASLASSALAVVEVLRALGQHGEGALDAGRELLDRINLVEVSRSVLDTAANLPPMVLRSLDAIHVASALLLGDECEGVVTYDARMQQAARDAGFAVLAPGQIS